MLTSPDSNPRTQTPMPSDERSQGTTRVLQSAELFAQTREVLIEHAGAQYRLRLTQSNKLILTK